MSGRKEYRVVYWRDGREQYQDGFPEKDLEWRSYFHKVRGHEVVRWEERTVTSPGWVTSPKD